MVAVVVVVSVLVQAGVVVNMTVELLVIGVMVTALDFTTSTP